MTRIRVDLSGSAAQAYDVVIAAGALHDIASIARQAAPAHRYALISDETVAGLWAQRVLDALASDGIDATLITFAAGEVNKTRETWTEVTDRMFELGFGRDSAVLSLGGGVVGDLAGFVAATYMRGVPVIQVPTTLLAMIDASIGGKTGVDAPAGKNLIGAFHQPSAVVVDPETLVSLPESELRGGLAEAVKHGVIADAAYLDWIVESARGLLTGDTNLLTALIQGSVRIKAGFVAKDTHESGARAALNFGHTIGHAIERAADYQLHHGFAVALGMIAEAHLGEAAGITAPGTSERIARVAGMLGLPTRLPGGLTVHQVLEHTRLDKKARRGTARYALITEIGKTARTADGDWTFPIGDDLATAALQALPAATL